MVKKVDCQAPEKQAQQTTADEGLGIPLGLLIIIVIVVVFLDFKFFGGTLTYLLLSIISRGRGGGGGGSRGGAAAVLQAVAVQDEDGNIHQVIQINVLGFRFMVKWSKRIQLGGIY